MSTTSSMTRRDRLIPWYFVLFFAVVIAVNVVFVTLALRSQPGVITDHAYEKGLAYNKVVDAASAQAALGWQGEISVAEGAGLTRQVTLTLKDKQHKPLVAQQLVLKATRPTQSGLDFEVTVKGNAGDITFPELGVWELRAFATVQGTPYQIAKRVVIE